MVCDFFALAMTAMQPRQGALKAFTVGRGGPHSCKRLLKRLVGIKRAPVTIPAMSPLPCHSIQLEILRKHHMSQEALEKGRV